MKCPGQDTRYWKPGDIFDTPCPNCGATMEFFKDESARRCRKCGQMAVNPRMDFGCASYCKYAAECLGELGPDLLKKRDDLLKDRVAVEVKRYLKRDFRRIGRAMKAARYAEEIARAEKADLPVVLGATYLAEIASEAGGTDEARVVLERLGARPELINEVLTTINEATGSSGGACSLNGRVVAEAYVLVSLDEGSRTIPPGSLVTETGQAIARKILSRGETT